MDQSTSLKNNKFWHDAVYLLLVADARVELGHIDRASFERLLRDPLRELIHQAKLRHGTVAEYQERYRSVRDLIERVTST